MKLITVVYAFFSSIGFSILFNIPRKEMIYAGLSGALGWLFYIIVIRGTYSVIFASFIGALVVGVVGEIFARIRKQPASIFVIPGMIPLVPGYGLYYSMLKIIEKNYDEALSVGFEAMLVAISIASAIIMATSFGRIMRGSNKQRVEKNHE